MCGIAGILTFGSTNFHLPHCLQEMSKLISHRGPDGDGFLFIGTDNKLATATSILPLNHPLSYSPKQHISEIANDFRIGIAHRRLSIIDLSERGHQPMCTTDQKIWITYNGEIYNYLELRKELISLGHNFVTSSDTEVILAAYKEWGSLFLRKLNGMFAIAIIDLARQQLFLARDRSGVKPLYYYQEGPVFAFASEQKALVSQPFVKTDINEAAFFDFYIKGELEYNEEGLFSNIKELPPAHEFVLDLKTGTTCLKSYYIFPFNNQWEEFDPGLLNRYKSNLSELLYHSIRLRMRSDVPVGACLSGGLDSSVISCQMDKLAKEEGRKEGLHLFTACFSDPRIDESQWAKIIADHTHSLWHKVSPEAKDFKRDLREMIYAQDLPIFSASTYAQFSVMRTVKEQGIKVVLDGQGGDELFAGYYPYYISYWLELLTNKQYALLYAEMKKFRGFSNSLSFLFKQFIRFYGLKRLPSLLQERFYHWYYPDVKYLNRDLWETHKSRLKETKEEMYASDHNLFCLNGLLQHEFYNTRLKHYLKCEDRCGMWFSVESRVPFADDTPLIEWALALPSAYKIHNGINKFILREATKGIIPVAISERKDKMGYVAPTNTWIDALKEDFMELFTPKLDRLIETKKLKEDYKTLFDLKNKEENGRIFKMIGAACWHDVFFGNK